MQRRSLERVRGRGGQSSNRTGRAHSLQTLRANQVQMIMKSRGVRACLPGQPVPYRRLRVLQPGRTGSTNISLRPSSGIRGRLS